MLHEIDTMHRQLKHDQQIRIKLGDEVDVLVNKSDLLKITATQMLRVIRPDGRLVSLNPEHVAFACIIPKGAY